MLFEKLCRLLVDMHDHVGTDGFAFCLLQDVLGIALATPLYGFRTFLPRSGDDLHLRRNHERRIKSQSEMADDGIHVIFVFFQEFIGSGKGDLVDVFFHLFTGHADPVVRYGEGLFFLFSTTLTLAPDMSPGYSPFERVPSAFEWHPRHSTRFRAGRCRGRNRGIS